MLYKLSRFSSFHTVLRKASYSLLWRIPYSIKYKLFNSVFKNIKPYSILRPGDTVVQVGAPWDILRSGRSRAVHFALTVGNKGKVLVFEPIDRSVQEMASVVDSLGIECVEQFPVGLWSHSCTLRFLSDPNHPASNIVSEVYADDRNDMNKYESTDVSVSALSSEIDPSKISSIRLLSLTTNGAEEKILEGITDEIMSKIEFLSVIDDPRKTSIYSNAGFEFHAEDDRGYLLKRNDLI